MSASNNPRISIIVPLYNAENFVAQCLDSVLTQTCTDFELLCVDDGSTDKTCELVQERASHDARVKLMRQQNAGPGVARNTALAQAGGEFIYCLDADDFLDRRMLARCMSALDSTQADMVLVGFSTYNEQVKRSFFADWSMRNIEVFPAAAAGTFSWKTQPNRFFETVQNVPWNKMIRAKLLRENDIRFQELRLSEDLMYSLPAAVAATKIVRLDDSLVYHREYTGTNAMADKGLYPLDFLAAFAALSAWLQERGVYGELRGSYRTWLLDAVYYNLPTYRNFEGLVAAYEYLRSDGLSVFDLADMDITEVLDHRHRAMLTALRLPTREQFLLACANIEADEVQEQRCGFQDRQMSLKWLLARLQERLGLSI